MSFTVKIIYFTEDLFNNKNKIKSFPTQLQIKFKVGRTNY